MKENLFDILNSHPNWEENIMEPATNREVCAALYKEMNQAAALYAESLLPLGDRWIRAVEKDIDEICSKEPPHTHFDKDRQKRYCLVVNNFLFDVSEALDRVFDISLLDRVTQWRLGRYSSNMQIKEGLSMDDADKLYYSMKKQGFRVHCFRELCSNLYTVLAYKVEASKTPTTKTPTIEQRAEKKQEQTPPPVKKRNRGRPQKEFEDFIINPDDAEELIIVLRELLNGKYGRDAARIIVACYHGGWINKPTVPSIERKFGIEGFGVKEPMRCHFDPPPHAKPKYLPFTDEELTPIVETIKEKLSKTI